MEKINDGGPAFPLDFMPVNLPGVPIGMTLRDYFAAKSLPMAWSQEGESPCGSHGEPTYRGVAERAYILADAMIKAREVKS